jgi:hypothetical protein
MKAHSVSPRWTSLLIDNAIHSIANGMLVEPVLEGVSVGRIAPIGSRRRRNLRELTADGAAIAR